MKLKTCFLVIIFALSFPALRAQELLWEVGFAMRFDNREYSKSNINHDQTIFGARINPRIGLGWNTVNSIFAGVDVVSEFGAKPFERDPEMILYYGYNGKKLNVYAGIFPRTKTLTEYTPAIISDSIRFYDSNIEGILINYVGTCGYVELGIDWLSMISDFRREKFMVFSAGRYNILPSAKLYAGYQAMVFHHSSSKTVHGVVDNILGYPYIGTDLSVNPDSKKGFLLDISAGWLQAAQNDRITGQGYTTPGGLQLRIKAEKWRVGIDNTLYVGDDLLPYYSRYGNSLYTGDPFYRTDGDLYNRLEVYWRPRIGRGMDLKVSSVHHYDGNVWNSQQLITFAVNLNQSSFGKKRNRVIAD